MTESGSDTPRADGSRAGVTALAALGVAALLIVAGGVTGVWMGARGAHPMMWGGAGSGPGPRVDAVAPAGFTLDGMPADMVVHYEHARDNADVYAQVPCFCGCQEMLGHRNLEDCFVTPDGAWESHASGCQVCIEESRMLMRMMGRGMGPEMMRGRIVGEFGGPMMGS